MFKFIGNLFGTFAKNPKTSLSGIPALLVAAGAVFGISIPSEVAVGAVSVSVFLIGLFSKDAKKDVPNSVTTSN